MWSCSHNVVEHCLFLEHLYIYSEVKLNGLTIVAVLTLNSVEILQPRLLLCTTETN